MNYKALALAAFITKTYALDPIAKYEPGSEVVDHSLMDLDQKSLEAAIPAEGKFPSVSGMAIYEQGGHSKSIVTLTLDEPLTVTIAKKTEFSGSDIEGNLLKGKAVEETPIGSTTLKLLYEPGKCMIGALDDDQRKFTGCITFIGSVFDGINTLTYRTPGGYNDNTNKRTLQGFSTAVREKMIECDACPEINAQEFLDYYGVPDWGDQWIQAANAGTSTLDVFDNGGADFSQYEYVGQFECIKKSTSYVQTLAYALHEFEASVAACQEGLSYDDANYDAIHKWDEGVAFYVGSLPGKDGLQEKGGKLHWALAGKRCKDFKTCGPKGGEGEGDLAQVNYKLQAIFTKGKLAIYEGKCTVANDAMLRISQLAYIPLIQGTLRYAHKVEKKVTEEKGQAEGATFASGVLPHVHAQGAKGRAAAQIIYDNMKVSNDPQTDFSAVKEAFESVYAEMGIDCEQIGGYLDDNDEFYGAPYDSSPCVSQCDPAFKRFDWKGMNLQLNCKSLNNLEATMKSSVCKAGGGAAACPQTCGGYCACTDKASAKFQKNAAGKMMSCKALSKARKRRQICNKKPQAKETCPVTCRNMCSFEPPFAAP